MFRVGKVPAAGFRGGTGDRMRFVPPAGTAIPASALFRAWATGFWKRNAESAMLQDFADFSGAKHVFGFSSGRVALWCILKALQRLRPDRNVVAIPAYTCFSVAAATVRAELKILPLEMDPRTIDVDYGCLEALPAKLLCIITANLFGRRSDTQRLLRVAHEKGAFLVDDLAQTMYSQWKTETANTRADVGFYSLGRGKPLPAGGGGIVTTDDVSISAAIADECSFLPDCSRLQEAFQLLKTSITTMFLPPRAYWIPNSLRFLRLGVTIFNPLFAATRLPRTSGVLLTELLPRLNEINGGRRKKTLLLASALRGNRFFWFPRNEIELEGSYIRFPVLAADRATRDRAVQCLRAAGVGATVMYPDAICDIADIRSHAAIENYHCLMAEQISERLFTLPTHSFVEEKDVSRIARILNRLGEELGATTISSASPESYLPPMFVKR